MVMEGKQGQTQNVAGSNTNVTVVPITIPELSSLLANGNMGGLIPSLIDPITGQVVPLSSISTPNH